MGWHHGIHRIAPARGKHTNSSDGVKFEQVRLAAIGALVPEETWSSEAIEHQLAPLYERLKLPEGRLELMSGISERRLWPAGTVPSGPSIAAGKAALEAAAVSPDSVGCLIHASVCRDFLEPATASRVHHGIGLPTDCWVYDVSNACLGIINGAVQIAMMIESGAIDAGIVVGTENSRMLLQSTIDSLNKDESLGRKNIKGAFASLTIGSGSCAWLLTHERLAPKASRLQVAIAEARTRYHDLCVSDSDSAGAGMQPLMETDSEKLMAEGIATGAAAFEKLLAESQWTRDSIDRSICHQVGVRHRKAMLDAMGLPLDRDSVTFPKLGNTGSVALPLTVAAAAHSGELNDQDRVAMLGIGSGINSVMWTAGWGETPIAGNLDQICAPGIEIAGKAL
jgi:3-oxoacyl-[acyl-carrier-protein] synthase-3